jgi:hypothetical protein
VSTFECNTLNDSTVMLMYLEQKHILLTPPYQREGEVWTLYKKQLLIDSLINGYDIPKLYLHEYDRARRIDGELIKYAIVDGKQRLLAIWQFMNGDFSLSNEIEYLRDPKIKLKGLTYEQLRQEHLAIHARFTGRMLSVITIRTGDVDLIEDMFSRLNEAVPLNAAEKRNAFGGPLPIAIRELVKDKFFTNKVTVSSTRYRHHDLACKLLYLEYQGRAAETKKSSLDEFVEEFAQKQLKKRTQDLLASVRRTLTPMCKIFKSSDQLLKSPGSVVVYFLLFRELQAHPSATKLKRRNFEGFEEKLKENRELAEEDLAKADWELLEYDRLSQTPNDASAIEFRLKMLRKHLLGISEDNAVSQATTGKPKKNK